MSRQLGSEVEAKDLFVNFLDKKSDKKRFQIINDNYKNRHSYIVDFTDTTRPGNFWGKIFHDGNPVSRKKLSEAPYIVYNRVKQKTNIQRLQDTTPIHLGKEYYLVIDEFAKTDIGEMVKRSTNTSRIQNMSKWKNYLIQTASGGSAMHKSGIAHVDVKPQNMLLYSDGTAVLTDLFSMAFLEKIRGRVVSSTSRASTLIFFDCDLLDHANDETKRFYYGEEADIAAFGLSEFTFWHPEGYTPYQMDDFMNIDSFMRHVEKLPVSKDDKNRIIKTNLPRPPRNPTGNIDWGKYRYTSLDLFIASLQGNDVELPSYRSMVNTPESIQFKKSIDEFLKLADTSRRNKNGWNGFLNFDYVHKLVTSYERLEGLYNNNVVHNVPGFADDFRQASLNFSDISRTENERALEKSSSLVDEKGNVANMDDLYNLSDLVYVWSKGDGWRGKYNPSSVSIQDIKNGLTPFRRNKKW